MPSTVTLNVGQTHHLTVTAEPAGADLSSLTYRSAPDGVVSLLADATGVNVKGLKGGTAQVFADVNGVDASGNPAKIEAECDATVATPLPLAVSLTLIPD